MKASIKFREGQKPLFRAKVPLKFLEFPFRSGIVAGESEELALNLTTSFESGPSLKVAYRPNDSDNPFCVVFKTETRHLRSPIPSSCNISAEFNLIGGVQKPRFFVHFKPHLGDFIEEKVQSTVFKKQTTSDAPVIVRLCKNSFNTPSESSAAGLVKGVLSDVEMTATMNVPLRKTAALSFRWAVSRTATEDSSMVLMKMNNPMAGISLQKLPCLTLNKIGIDCKVLPSRIDAENFLGVKKQLENIEAENRALDKGMSNLTCEYFNRLEITRAKNGTSKEALDDLSREFMTHRVLRVLGLAIVGLVTES